jgi:hypothetical protein
MATAYARRELQEILFSLFYAKYFNHGTGGHQAYTVQAKQARSAGKGDIRLVLVNLFDQDQGHLPDDIVAKAIEAHPEQFLVEAPRSK